MKCEVNGEAEQRRRVETYPLLLVGGIYAADNTTTPYDPIFALHPFDPAAQMYRAPYRVYDPDSARWTERDPLGMVDGPNMYAYVGGGVVERWDPSGLIRAPGESQHDCWVRILGELSPEITALGLECTVIGAICPPCATPCFFSVGGAALIVMLMDCLAPSPYPSPDPCPVKKGPTPPDPRHPVPVPVPVPWPSPDPLPPRRDRVQ